VILIRINKEEIKVQLLIVDDEVHVVERMLNTFDWKSIGIEHVYGAYSASEALSLLHQFSIDIVITDIYMPGMSGIQLIAEIRKRWRKTKCILLSGYSDFMYAKEAIQLQTECYLIKPVDSKELIDTVGNTVKKLRQEWEEVVSRQKLEKTLQDNLPFLRSKLLNELLSGQHTSVASLEDKMQLLGLPGFIDKPAAIMIVRLEEPFNEYNFRDLSLIEYAIDNVIEELFDQNFYIWQTKDINDYLVITVAEKTELQECERSKLFERAASQLQETVGQYFKGKISVMVSGWGLFPLDISSRYNSSVSAFRLQVGNSKNIFMRVDDELVLLEVQSLQSLRNPPSLQQLLEMGRWKDAEQKLLEIFTELQQKWVDSQDHILEVFYHISAAYACIIHKNGYQLSQVFAYDYEKLTSGLPFTSINLLREWSLRVLARLIADMDRDNVDKRTSIINKIYNIIDSQLSEDVSLQRIADQVFLHPSYVSRIFKLETGENISEYVQRIRMEKAEYLLKNSPMKIYEISAVLGYLRPHSFNYSFKKEFGITPQGYRDQSSK
jgi:two-component system response regulator YesN